MLGHQLWRHFSRGNETWVTLRRQSAEFERLGLFTDKKVFAGLDAMDFEQLAHIIRKLNPDAVLNCVGIIKQLKEAKDAVQSITINSLLPHRLAEICAETGSRLVLFSTDCVFSGRRGSYTESDISDAEDIYGRTKYLGEVANAAHVITLRSSIIGREIGSAYSLVDWFLAQKEPRVRGFRRAIYTGFTTIEMARIVERVIDGQRGLHGLWQVASAAITKFDLLHLLRDSYGLGVQIDPADEPVCDRSLIGTRFNDTTGYRPPSWPAMIGEMATQNPAT